MNPDSIVKTFSRNDGKLTLMTPFVVSKKKKTIYFHIGKTGGSSITNILRQHGMDDMFLTDRKKSIAEKLQYFSQLAQEWENYYTFTFVRNKYSQLVSLWHYDGHPGGTFENFIKNCVAPSEDQYGYWLDQYYLTMVDGECIFDFVGRTENFSEDVQCVMSQVGIDNYDVKRYVNKGKYDRTKHFSEYYDDEIQAIVYNKFKKEIDYFGFQCEK